MRVPLYAMVGAAALALVGCSGSTTVTPSPGSPPAGDPLPQALPAGGAVALGGVATSGVLSEQAMALYTVQLDPTTLSATLTPKEVRQGQANDDVTDLDVSCFLSGGSVKLVQVAKSVGTLDLTYSFAHPFANTAPHTLGAPVRALVMVDSEAGAPTFFAGDGDIVVNTGLVANANGYLDPGQLLDTTGFTANAFPYQVLVDEELDNRDVSNGGDVFGNWDDVAGEGWQTGLPGTWTGFGWLHKGQVATRTLSLNLVALGASPVTFDLAFIAKYAKPNRSGLTKSPSAPANTLDFAYRAYHGALDCELVEFTYETGGFIAESISASTIYFKVRDWDARATEIDGVTVTDLKDATDASLVAVGESGVPVVELSIPDVLGTTIVPMTTVLDDDTALNPPNGDIDIDNGGAMDELFYCQGVVRASGSTGAGDTTGFKTGLVRAIDPEATADTSLWRFAIDCATLGVVTGPGTTVYNVFTVFQAPNNAPPTANVALTSANPMNSGTSASLSLTGITDTDNDPIDIYIDWGDGAGFPGTPDISLPVGPVYADQAPVGPQMNNLDLVVDNINMVVRLDDGTDQTDYPLSYDLGPNLPPQVTVGTVSLQAASGNEPFTFTLSAAGLTVTDPEGIDVPDFTVTATPTTGAPQSASAIVAVNGYNAAPVMGPWNVANSTIAFNVYANDTLHTGIGGTLVPSSPLVGTVNSGCAPGSLPGVGDITLATLTTGGVPRAGVGALQPVTGIRVTWTDIAGEGAYAIYRGELLPGSPVALAIWALRGTVGAGVTTYDDSISTAEASGRRWVYRVFPRCSAGGVDGPTASQLGIAALQNWETVAPANIVGTVAQGWTVSAECITGTCVGAVADVGGAWTAINGTRDLRFSTLSSTLAAFPTERWMMVAPPALLAADWTALLPTFSTSTYEQTQDLTGAATWSFGGLAFVTGDTYPANNAVTAFLAGHTHVPLAASSLGSQNYDSSWASHAEWLGTAVPTGNNVYRFLTAGLLARKDCTAQQITANHRLLMVAVKGVASSASTAAPQQQIDECAWLIY